jgi:hypothetical protein
MCNSTIERMAHVELDHIRVFKDGVTSVCVREPTACAVAAVELGRENVAVIDVQTFTRKLMVVNAEARDEILL